METKMETIERHAYSLRDFCKAFSLGETKAREEIRSGRLKAKKMGRRVFITEQAAQTWLANMPDAA